MRLASVSLFVAALATFAVLSTAQSAPGDRYGLHPTCGNIRRGVVSGSRTVISQANSTELEVSCISYNVMPTTNCTVGPHRMVLDFFDPLTGTGQSVDVDTLYTGSMYATAFRFNTARLITMYLDYAAYASCPVHVYFTVYAEVTIRRPAPVEHPYVTSASPLVMYRGEPYTIRMRSPASLTPSQQGEVRAVLVTALQSCRRDAPGVFANLESSNPGSTRVSFSDTQNLTWTVTAEHNGGFAVCMRTTSGGDWAIVAFVEAYGANPAFFDTTEIRRTRSTITYRFDFFGHALNALTDRLRMVEGDDASRCGANPEASDDVTVSGLQHVTTNQTTATVTFERNELYLVCYLHAASGRWVDVPNFDTMSRHVIANVTSADQNRANHESQFTNTSDPIVGPSPQEPGSMITTCASAPINAANELVTTDQLVQLTLTDTTVPGDFTTQIARLLCVPLSYVRIYRIQDAAAAPGHKDVFIRVECVPGVCNSAERMAALVQYRGSLINVGSARVTTFNGVAVGSAPSVQDHPTADDDDSQALAIALGVVAAILVATIVVLIIVLRHRNRRRAIDEDVVQGHVVEVGAVQPHSHNTLNAPNTNDDTHDLYGGSNGAGSSGYPARREEDDASPLPPPPTKPRAEGH